MERGEGEGEGGGSERVEKDLENQKNLETLTHDNFRNELLL